METTQAAPPLHILVIDDEPGILEILSVCLGDAGHKVETAADGDNGWERFQSDTWDLVLTDRIMPGMTGDQLAKAIKQVSPHTPVVMTTGILDAKSAAAMREAGVDVFIRKPFTLSSLRDAITEARAMHFGAQKVA